MNFLKTLSHYHPLPKPLQAYLATIVEKRSLPAGHILLTPGSFSHYIYFIEKGCAMKYYYRDSTQVVTWFMKENDFFLSVDSFFNRKPADEYIELLENTNLYMITYSQFLTLKQGFHEIREITEQIQRKHYIEEKALFRKFRSLNNEEKYDYLHTHYREIIRRVPLKYIASFLQMTPQHLSKIRRKRRQ